MTNTLTPEGLDAMRARAESWIALWGRCPTEILELSRDVLALLDALHQVTKERDELHRQHCADLDALFIQAKAECERDRLAADLRTRESKYAMGREFTDRLQAENAHLRDATERLKGSVVDMLAENAKLRAVAEAARGLYALVDHIAYMPLDMALAALDQQSPADEGET